MARRIAEGAPCIGIQRCSRNRASEAFARPCRHAATARGGGDRRLPGRREHAGDGRGAWPTGRSLRVFASVPAPGHPFGIAVDNGRVYVSTSAGDFFADPANGGHRNSDGERVFTLTRRRPPRHDEHRHDAGRDDGPVGHRRRRQHGSPACPVRRRHERPDPARTARAGGGGSPSVFSQVPADTGLAGDWMLSMWNDLVFDPAGNLYVPDDKPRIWRVGPDGHASIWFTDPRLAGFFGFAGGPLGARIDPSGRWLYFSITVSAEFPLEGVIYRIRLVDHPTAADLQLVHRFPLVPNADPPQPGPIAFSASGNLYVSLLGPSQVAILDPGGDEIGASRARCSTRPGASRSPGSPSWSPTVTSSRATIRTRGRCSRCSSASEACPSTSPGCPPAEGPAHHARGPTTERRMIDGTVRARGDERAR